MATKKVSGKSLKAKRTGPSSKPIALASAQPKAKTKAKPFMGDFTHSLYWDGSADKRDSTPLANQNVTHQIILVERKRRNNPKPYDKDYVIVGGSSDKQVAGLVASEFGRRTYYEASPDEKRVKFVIKDKFHQVVHVFYTDYYEHGILVVPGGGKVKIFGPDTKLDVCATNPPPVRRSKS